MDEALLKLIELLEKTAPEVWAAAVRQAQVSAIYNGIFLVLCLGVMVAAVWAIVYFLKQDEDLESSFTVCATGFLISLGVSFFIVPKFLTALLNPEYYAIQQLLALVK